MGGEERGGLEECRGGEGGGGSKQTLNSQMGMEGKKGKFEQPGIRVSFYS